jgi:chromosome segregation ATPase
VKVLQEPRFTWAPAIIEMYRRMERDINAGFDGAAIEAYNQRAAMQQQISDLSMLLGQRAHELETARAGIAAYHAQSTASTARAEALAGDLESFKGAELAQRSKAEQLERVNADLQREIAALTARAAELEKLWEADRTTAQALDRQRRTFVESVSKHIRP